MDKNPLRPSLANERGAIYATGAEETKSHFMPDLSPELLALGFIWYVAFLFSTTCHEAAHALAAKIGGDDTAFAGGQVSLNPMPILSLIINRSIIGWASAPYNPEWERRHPRRAAWMALAGPATNYTLMLIAAVALRLGWSQGWLQDHVTGKPDFASSVLGAFFSLNLLLGTFNLLPVPPLDGSTAIMLFMGETRSQRYLDWLRGNSYAMVGLLLAIVAFRYVYAPIKAFATYYLLQSHF